MALDLAELDRLFADLLTHQERRVRAVARRIVPEVTLDDLLCPDDVPALKASPEFLYEDGVLAGLLAAHTAVRAAARRAADDDGPTS